MLFAWPDRASARPQVRNKRCRDSYPEGFGSNPDQSQRGGPSTLSSTGTGTLTLTYAICTLYDSTRAVKSGAAYPIKLQLCDVNGVNISAGSIQVKAVNLKLVSQQTNDLEVIDAGDANPDSNFRFDADLAGYIFNLTTTGLSSGVYKLHFTAGDDPTVHAVEFRVK